MRLVNFLNEENPLEEIKLQCPKAWELSEQRFKFFRGMNENKRFGKKTVRTDRRPRDSKLFIHNALDQAFKAVFGIPLRSASLFTSGDYEQTEVFGNIFQIFPSDDFEVYWSPYLYDLASSDCSPLGFTDNLPLCAFFAAADRQHRLSYWSDSRILKLGEFLDSEFHDVYLNGSDEEIVNAILKKYPNVLVDFVKKFYRKGNPKSAISSGNEIMITCSFYYFKKV